jgi:hypothetical protein
MAITNRRVVNNRNTMSTYSRRKAGINKCPAAYFGDASQNVYSAVAYMRTEAVLGVALRFVQAKSRLKPIKAAFTIPRMELLAAKMGLALAKQLITVLNDRHQAICLWTDFRAAHDWLRVESQALQVFEKK